MASTLTPSNGAVTPRHPKAIRAEGPQSASPQQIRSLIELETTMPSEIAAISQTVENLMHVIEASHSVEGNEFAVEFALREALNNAVIHGNGMDDGKSVEICCRCDSETGVWLVIRDQGKGFDPTAVPNPLAPERLQAEHGRGIHLMKSLMDEVSFLLGGTEVHMRKRPARQAVELPSNG